MTVTEFQRPHDGAAMDRTRPAGPRLSRRRRMALAGACAAAGIALLAWLALPRGFPVARADLDIATVQPGLFHDELVTRATVRPLQSVLLDASEDGRVESVRVKDGAEVQAGQLLYVLASSQHAQELMARSSEAAQQLANLATFRAELMAAQAAHRRLLTQADFDLRSARRAYERDQALVAQGFVSAAALAESADRFAQARQLLAQARDDGREELATREQSVRAMARAVRDLDQRLATMRAASDGLAVRAPVAGRLTGFSLQIGESVHAGSHVARIDSLDRFRLDAFLDEFYLPRISPGLHGVLEHEGRRDGITVARIDPLVQDGRFRVALAFDAGGPAGLRVGEGLDVRLTLGRPAPALLLRDGGFYADSGGAWAFVLDPDGRHAQRRAVRLGRRAAGQIEVLGGIRAGEQVIVSSYRAFRDAKTLQLED